MMKDKLELARQLNLSKMVRQVTNDLDKYKPNKDQQDEKVEQSQGFKNSDVDADEFALSVEPEFDVNLPDFDLKEDLNPLLKDFCKEIENDVYDVSTGKI